MLNFNRKWSRTKINGHDCVDAVGYMKIKERLGHGLVKSSGWISSVQVTLF